MDKNREKRIGMLELYFLKTPQKEALNAWIIKDALPYTLILYRKSYQISENVPILHLKRIIRLSKTLWYQFQRVTYWWSIYQQWFQQKTEVKETKLSQMDKKRLKTVIYISLKNTFQSRKVNHWTQCIKKHFSRSKKNSSHGYFIYFYFRSKGVCTNSTKELKNQNSYSSCKKSPRNTATLS